MRCVAVRHVAFEDLGIWEAEITAHGYQVVYLDAGVDDLTPLASAEMGIVLGGPVGVGDVEAYPVLAEEMALLASRHASGLPTLGVCLGAQLLAAALGGAVTAGEPEIGWAPVDLAPDASSLRALEGAPVLHWHGDRITPPPGAATLASTAGTPCQAFSLGASLGLQFHPEVDAERIERWLIGHSGELRELGIDPGDVRAASREHGDDAAVAGILLIRQWLREMAA